MLQIRWPVRLLAAIGVGLQAVQRCYLRVRLSGTTVTCRRRISSRLLTFCNPITLADDSVTARFEFKI